MLKLENIVKNYTTENDVVNALKSVSLSFRRSEFVSILGPSGCGKTTLLNIIGGLDKYTTGDLIINGISTKKYKDKDWDNYRNHSIGFVFQSYNLIPHQTILENVEIALTLSGVGKKERKRRATEALKKVGLSDKIKAKPSQLSGGQMQRVAIARALVNDPDILLADEPTGALDSKTSVQIMELLKEISKNKLVIMVTHNPSLANDYSTRIVKLMDGELTYDSNPFNQDDNEIKNNEKSEKTKSSMSFFTALSLSFKNLLTKKTRSLLVSFAGSIGIIGIALILSLSNGFQLYIDKVQEDTLSTYPVSIEQKTIDMGSVLEKIIGSNKKTEEREEGKIYSSTVMVEMLQTMMEQQYENNLKEFKNYLENNNDLIKNYVSDIKYNYNIDLNIFNENSFGKYVKVNPSNIMNDIMPTSTGSANMSTLKIFSEMIDNEDLITSQYEILAGSFPNNKDEVVLVVNENNEINDYALYALGIKDQKELKDMMSKIMKGEEVEIKESEYSFNELLNIKFKLVLQTDYYVKEESGEYSYKGEDEAYMRDLLENSFELKVVGIIKPNKKAAAQSINGVIAYRSDLTKYVINLINEKEIVKEQLQNENIDVFSNKPFPKNEYTIEEIEFMVSEMAKEMGSFIQDIYNNQKANFLNECGGNEEEANKKIIAYYSNVMNDNSSESTYENNLKLLGVNNLDSPSMISFYPKDFASKDEIINIIKNYNDMQIEEGNEGNVIQYTDYIGILLSSISDVIDAITYVLIAFVSISLIVSSIMIGIITYISVLERIKEIGILRAVGASKRDISNVFNAETLIIGLSSGLIGVLVTIVLDIPINIIIYKLGNIPNVAKLPFYGAIGLIIISVVLSVFAGLIPSRLAAKKDPVVCLRSE